MTADLAPRIAELAQQIDPQQRAANARNAELAKALGGGTTVAELRELYARGRVWWHEGGARMAEQRDLTIPGLYGPVAARLYKPVAAAGLPVFVFLHGGGYRIGWPAANDREMREIAARWGGAVLSLDYVHVPEHVFPDAVLETAAVFEWLGANAGTLGLDPARIAFGGASAGGSVSMGAAIELRGRRPGLLKAGCLLYSCLDDTLDDEAMRLFGNGEFFLTRDYCGQIFDSYVPDRAKRGDPRAFACKLDDFAGLPPLFVAPAEFDPLTGGAERFAAKLAAAGHPHRLKVYPKVLHAFFGYSRMMDRANELIGDVAAFLSDTVGQR
ncbi:MAG: alpha/beta hydrolase fold domain-containing protein [Alphaproteobacteria bacterium]